MLVTTRVTMARHYTYTIDHTPVGEAQIHGDLHAHVFEIWSFEIYPPYQRTGYGEAFYRQLEARIPRNTSVVLWVKQDNEEGLAFWQAMGFEAGFANIRGYRMYKEI